jgi:tetratricopeptide (TPR) repeat protein
LFLHTGGWTNSVESFGERRIEYDDGTKEIIRLNSTNMADWNPGVDSFPNEEGTTTTVAWKGANTQYPVIRVYQTLWVNPHLEKTIKQVVISNAGLEQKQWRFVAHLGLTAAILSPGSTLPAAAKDPEKSRTLFHEAAALIEKKQTNEATAKLQAALDADDQNTAAWTALTGLRAETDNIDAFTALCRRWAQVMPKNYQPHNVLGKYLEDTGKLAEALAEYRKSNEIEPNQPPVWSDIERLEKKLKEGSTSK